MPELVASVFNTICYAGRVIPVLSSSASQLEHIRLLTTVLLTSRQTVPYVLKLVHELIHYCLVQYVLVAHENVLF